ncbi:MAG: hypothetical protein H7257_14455, partial [Taibaiella sp.]|nr:hypothetical protein [Taibaiella sp.]
MRKLYFLLALFFTSFFEVSGQYNTPQNTIWAFGTAAGLDFTSGSPSPIRTAISTSEGCASVSDASGALLFYTDGRRVWDRTNAVMPAGSAIVSFGTSSSTQGALICPVIGTTSQYYIFSLEDYLGSTGYCHLVYCIVDMSMRTGLGDVVASSVGTTMTNLLGEKMTAIPGDNCDLWVMVHRRDSTKFLAYNVSASGVSTTPVVSTVGTRTGTNSYIVGVIKSSNDRTKIVSQQYTVGSGSGTELYDFNPGTGVVSNCRLLDSSTSQYGADFSPDNTKLYTQGSGQLYQYDITAGGGTAAAIRATKTSIGSCYTWTDMRLAPDGKIYMLGSTTSRLNCIATPNVAGTGCGYTTSAVTLLSGTSGVFGMTNMFVTVSGGDTTTHRRDTVACIPTTSGTITIGTAITGTGYIWNDGVTTQTRTISAFGTYWVVIDNGCHKDIDTIVVTRQTPTFTNRIHDTAVCGLLFPITLSVPSGF